jgi:hypothetical protein
MAGSWPELSGAINRQRSDERRQRGPSCGDDGDWCRSALSPTPIFPGHSHAHSHLIPPPLLRPGSLTSGRAAPDRRGDGYSPKNREESTDDHGGRLISSEPGLHWPQRLGGSATMDRLDGINFPKPPDLFTNADNLLASVRTALQEPLLRRVRDARQIVCHTFTLRRTASAHRPLIRPCIRSRENTVGREPPAT